MCLVTNLATIMNEKYFSLVKQGVDYKLVSKQAVRKVSSNIILATGDAQVLKGALYAVGGA